MKDNNFKTRSCECCIIGAGPAGLGAALELVRQGLGDILIVDKNRVPGGLCRTDTFEGIRFDTGPHRFFTRDSMIYKLWHDTLGDNFIPVRRFTRIRYENKYFNYPLRFADIFKLGPVESFSAFVSFVISRGKTNRKTVTFEDWAVRKFGPDLYLKFFKVYTEKVWGLPCSKISAEWAEQRIKGLGISGILKKMLLPSGENEVRTMAGCFSYPALGAGQMYEALGDKIASSGVPFILGSAANKFNRKNNLIESVDVADERGEKVRIFAKQFFSSVPLKQLFSSFDPPAPAPVIQCTDKLIYRGHITVNLVVEKEGLFPDQWLYIHSPEIKMARLANYNNFSSSMVPSKSITALSAEYFAFKDDFLWGMADKDLFDLAIDELGRLGLFSGANVRFAGLVREPDAYPVYGMGFEGFYNRMSAIAADFPNLYTIGRAGLHKYNNQDHSLLSGILAARNYLESPGAPYDLWRINTDKGYSED